MANPTGPARCDGHTGAARRAHPCTVWERYVKCENQGEWRNFAVAHNIKTYQTKCLPSIIAFKTQTWAIRKLKKGMKAKRKGLKIKMAIKTQVTQMI